MFQKADWWARKFIEKTQDIAIACNQFSISHEIDGFNKTYTLHEE